MNHAADTTPPRKASATRRPALHLSAALWLLAAACTAGSMAPTRDGASAAQASPHGAGDARRRRGMTREVTAREMRVIDELMSTAERVRRLRFQRAVPVSVQDSDAIMGYVDEQIESEQLEKATDVYRALGLLPDELDVHELLLRLMGEQIVGYYDAQEARLVVRDDVMEAFGKRSAARDVDLAEARIVLVHELVHALQDQNLSLSENIERERDSDADSAFRALIEGDATLAMIGYALEQESVPLSALTSNPARVHNLSEVVRSTPLTGSELNNAPAILRVPLLSAYVDGLAFVANLHGDGGWGRVDRSHAEPPVSTEQVLHPERYARLEAPERPRLTRLARELAELGYELRHEDTLGELEIGVYFGQALPEAEAARAADGWGGDRLYAFQHEAGGRPAIAWLTTWDDETEARQAAAAAERVGALLDERGRAQLLTLHQGRSVLIGRWLPDRIRDRVAQQFRAVAGESMNEPPPAASD